MIVLRNHRYEWESPLIARPGCETFGLNGAWGLYARWLTSNPSNPGGYTIYRPDVSQQRSTSHRSSDADRCCEQHWALEGTGLRYGDQLAGSAEGAVIFGFEVDGLDCKTLTDHRAPSSRGLL